MAAAIEAGDVALALGHLSALHSAGSAQNVAAQQVLLQKLVRLALARDTRDGLEALVQELTRCSRTNGSPCLYNSVLDACIECHVLPAAEEIWGVCAAAGLGFGFT
jgi:hypothetical protein